MPLAVQSGIHTIIPVTSFVWVLVLASLTTAAARYLNLPYIVLLVVLGVVVGSFGWLQAVRPTSEVILLVFLPPLLFEAGLEIDMAALGRTLPIVVWLAVPGVVLTTLLVGAAVHAFTPLLIYPALIFGALIAATDPVSVVATFRQLGAPVDLTTMIEGESLFNDGTALVLSSVLLSAAETGRLDLAVAVGSFIWAVLAGVLIGVALAVGTAQIVKRLNDPHVETTLSVALAYGAFLIATRVGASGAVSVVVSGLIFGSYGRRVAVQGESRRVLDGFWAYAGFLANAVLFVLIGLEIRLGVLWTNIGWIGISIAAVIVVRALMVYFLTWRLRRITTPYGHVLFWGGLRGGVAVAIALSLPQSVPGRPLIVALTFGVVLFTVLIQGLTIDPLAQRLGLVETAHSPRPTGPSAPAG